MGKKKLSPEKEAALDAARATKAANVLLHGALLRRKRAAPAKIMRKRSTRRTGVRSASCRRRRRRRRTPSGRRRHKKRAAAGAATAFLAISIALHGAVQLHEYVLYEF